MAATTEVTAVYRSDTSSYVRGVKQATEATEEFASTLQAAQNSGGELKASTVAVGAAFGTLATMAILKATNAIKTFAQEGLAMAASYEQVVISMEGIFQGMGMSAEQAAAKTQTFLNELRDFAAKTPFEMTQLLDATKRLLTLGYTAEEVKDRMLPALGDLAAALGATPASIDAVVYAMGQIKSAGRVMQQDLMQIGNAFPGFNARMAIAKELFNGDMNAMAEAVQKGTLSGEQAIEALITAMEKFPGAAGAMERQSQTLNGVLSTFRDNIDMALIDGIAPALPVLSQAMQDLVDPVKNVATAFASELGPTIVSIVEAVTEAAPSLSELATTLVQTLGTSVKTVVDILKDLSPIITVVAKAVQIFGKIIQALPAPIIAAAAAMLLMTTRLGSALITGLGAATIGMTRFGASVLTTSATSATGFSAIGASAVASMRVTDGAMKAATVAVNGFKLAISSTGIGLLIVGISTALTALALSSEDAAAGADDFTQSILEQNGALVENHRALIAKQFQEKGILDAASKAGIVTSELVDAYLAGGDALAPYVQRLYEYADSIAVGYTAGKNYTQGNAELTGQVRAAAAALDPYVGALDRERAALDATKLAAEGVAGVTANNAAETGKMSMAAIRAAEAAGLLGGAATVAGTGVDGMGLEAGETAAEIEELKTSIEMLLGTLDMIDAVDRFTTALRELKPSGEDAKAALFGTSEAAIDFRGKVVSAIRDAAAAAELLGEGPAEQAAIFADNLSQIVNQLRDQGIKDSDIEAFLGALDNLPASVDTIMKQANAALSKGAKNFETTLQRDIRKAFKSGEIVTADGAQRMADAANRKAKSELGIGLKQEITDALKAASSAFSTDTTVQKAAESMAKEAATATGQEMDSTLGPEVRDAVTKAAAAGSVAATAAAPAIGANIAAGAAQGIRNATQQVIDAAVAMVKEAIAAAKAAAEESSPSKVFIRIGENMSIGTAIGITNRARDAARASGQLVKDLIAAAERALQDATWDAGDAADAIRDAEKRLEEAKNIVSEAQKQVDEARKALSDAKESGDAAAVKDAEQALRDAEEALAQAREDMPHEVAAAERDLARARRDATDAALAQYEAEKNLAALRKISFEQGAVAWKKFVDSAFNTGDLSDFFEQVEFNIRQRLIAAGATREFAESVAGDMVQALQDQAEVDIRRLTMMQERLAALLEKIKRLQEAREEGRQSFLQLFRRRFGDKSEWEKFWADGNYTIDRVTDLYDRLVEAVKLRFAGFEGGAKDKILTALKLRFKAIAELIKRRDEVLKQLEVAKENLDRAEKAQEAIEDILSKPLGEPSELDKALDVADLTADRLVSLFDRLSGIIRQRYTVARLNAATGETYEEFLAVGQELIDGLDAQMRRLVELTRRRDDVLKRLAEAEKTLGDLVAAREQMAKKIADAIKNVFVADQSVTSAELYVTGLRQRLEATRDFIKGIETLRARGVSSTLIQQLLDKGPEAGRLLVASLVGASDAQIEEINSILATAGAVGDAYGDYAAGVVYDDEIAKAQNAVNVLRAERDEILAEMQGIADYITRMMAQIAADSGEGSVLWAQAIVAGLESQRAAIEAAIQQLVDGIQDILAELGSSMYDLGADGGRDLLAGYVEQGKALVKAIQKIAQAIADMIASALGIKARKIEIPQSVLDLLGMDTGAAGARAASRAASRSSNGGETVTFGAGSVQVTVNAGDGSNLVDLEAAVRKAMEDAMNEIARRSQNARR